MKRTIFALLSLLLSAGIQAADAPRTGSFSTSFDTAAPYAKANVVMQRMMLGEVLRDSVQAAAQQGINLNAHTVNPAEETWDVYVPTDYDGSQALGVLVYLPINPAMEIPNPWKDAFDKHHMIYIAPRKAGDDEPTMERRIPLALHGLNGILQQYKVDTKHIYIAGEGGGAVVAGNMALGFADIFQGAVFYMDAPSFGTAESPVLAAPLLERARHVHYALVATRDDNVARRIAQAAEKSMRDLCISNVQTIARPDSGDGTLMMTALDYITQPPIAVTAGSCTVELQNRSQAAVAEVRKLIEQGDDLDAAAEAWQQTYLQYGNLIDAEMHKLKETLTAKQRQRTPSASLSRY